MNDYNIKITELFLRLVVGALFLVQGYNKLFRIKITAAVEIFTRKLWRYILSFRRLYAIACSTGLVEFASGLMVLVFLFTNFALNTLGVKLLVVSFALTFMKPMWNKKHGLFRFAFVILILIAPTQYNISLSRPLFYLNK